MTRHEDGAWGHRNSAFVYKQSNLKRCKANLWNYLILMFHEHGQYFLMWWKTKKARERTFPSVLFFGHKFCKRVSVQNLLQSDLIQVLIYLLLLKTILIKWKEDLNSACCLPHLLTLAAFYSKGKMSPFNWGKKLVKNFMSLFFWTKWNAHSCSL